MTRDGRLHWFKAYLGNINTDNPQLDDECALRHGGRTFHPLRDTLMPRELVGEVVPLKEQEEGGSKCVCVAAQAVDS